MNGRVPAKYSPLKQSQLDVLQWVADGCPEDVWASDAHKLVARALANRDLIAVNRRQGRWAAEILPGGTYYLAHGEFDPAVVGHYDRLLQSSGKPSGASSGGALENRVHAAIPGLGDSVQERVGDKQIDGARHVGVAQGTSSHASADDQLPDGSPESPNNAKPTRHHLHPLVRTLRDTKALSHISKDHQPRALDLLSELARGADSRGFTVSGRKMQERRGYEANRGREPGLIYIDAGGRRVGVDIRQHQTRTAHIPTKKELEDEARYKFASYPRHDYTPNERLHIVLHGASPDNWEQLKKTALEERLPDILNAIEKAAVDALRREEEARVRKQERRVQWEEARSKAENEWLEAHRAEVLTQQADRWLQTRYLRDYLVALDTQIAGMDSKGDVEAARQWQRCASEYVDNIDPLAQPLAMPHPPKPSPDALKPFMKGWNPYGPDDRGFF